MKKKIVWLFLFILMITTILQLTFYDYSASMPNVSDSDAQINPFIYREPND